MEGHRKIIVTDSHVQRLLSDLREVAAGAVGEHLVEEDFVGYTAEALLVEDIERIDRHLAGCAACAAEMEQLVEAGEAWRGGTGRARLAALRARVGPRPAASPQAAARSVRPAWEDLAAFLGGLLPGPITLSSNVALAVATGSTTPSWVDGQTEDGTLGWRMVQDDDGNLTVRLGSREPALEGLRLRLAAGGVEREVILGRVAFGQVGAEVVITAEERSRLPDGTPLRIEVVPEEAEAGGSGQGGGLSNEE